jgi:hypothetical protein
MGCIIQQTQRNKKGVDINANKAFIVGSSFSMRQNYIVRRNIWLGGKERCKLPPRETDKNLIDNSHSGEMSATSQKKIRCAVNWLCASAQQKWIPECAQHKGFYFKVNFITLTLPCTNSHITHENIFKLLLEKFLDNARANWGLNLYTWKIELQKNGSPHVHIATDTYINYYKLRKYWNSLLSKEGVLQHYTDKHNGCSFEQYISWYPPNDFCDVSRSYERWSLGNKMGWTDPNTTDVHAVRHIKDLPAYISKYMAKELTSEIMVQGLSALATPRSTARMWGCSLALSKKFKDTLDVYSDEYEDEDSSLFNAALHVKQILGKKDRCGIQHPVADIIFIKPYQWHSVVKGRFYRYYQRSILELRNAHKSDAVVKTMLPDKVLSLN